MRLPTSVEPVNAILCTSGWFTRAAPVEPSPVMMLTTPGGRSISASIFRESQRRQRRRFRRLQDARVAAREGRRQFPRGHQQGEIPRDDLPAHAHRFG